MTEDKNPAVAMLGLIAGLAQFPLSAFVLQKLWIWHLTPVFGVQAPDLPRCLGLAMLCALVTHQSKDEPKDEVHHYAYLILEPIIILLIGWVCR